MALDLHHPSGNKFTHSNATRHQAVAATLGTYSVAFFDEFLGDFAVAL